jgi:hypothetical protein
MLSKAEAKLMYVAPFKKVLSQVTLTQQARDMLRGADEETP